MRGATAVRPVEDGLAFSWRDMIASKGKSLKGWQVIVETPRWDIRGEVIQITASWNKEGTEITALQIVLNGKRVSKYREVLVCNAIVDLSTSNAELSNNGDDIVVSSPGLCILFNRVSLVSE